MQYSRPGVDDADRRGDNHTHSHTRPPQSLGAQTGDGTCRTVVRRPGEQTRCFDRCSPPTYRATRRLTLTFRSRRRPTHQTSRRSPTTRLLKRTAEGMAAATRTAEGVAAVTVETRVAVLAAAASQTTRSRRMRRTSTGHRAHQATGVPEAVLLRKRAGSTLGNSFEESYKRGVDGTNVCRASRTRSCPSRLCTAVTQKAEDGRLKIYEGLPRGMCTPNRDMINPNLLAFIQS
jgi:hypothetical protein